MTPVNFTSRRSPVYSRRGIVATSQPLATAAGIEVLSKSGVGGEKIKILDAFSHTLN